MARVLVGVSGGIAAYKTVELVRLAQKAGHAVRVVMTPDAERFVGGATFVGITGAPVLTSAWEPDPARGAFPDQAPPDHAPISHLALAANADALLVAPATANTLAKLAHGLAPDLLSEVALAAICPLVLAPAMNAHMWTHPATQANVALLRERGAVVLEPGTGDLASHGEHGAGRLPEPPALLAAVEAVLPQTNGPTNGLRPSVPGPSVPCAAGPLEGLRVLVTAGGTREPIDAVRWLGNRSSGRMGWALAEEAAGRGADVEVLAAHVALPRAPGIAYTQTGTAQELLAAAEAAFARADVLLMAAAVADFRPTAAAATKLKKDQGVPELSLEPTQDVLATLSAQRRPGQVLVGFAAETGDGAVEYGRVKLARKGLDLVVVNDVAREGVGFEAADNEVWLLAADGAERHVARTSKAEVARVVIDEVMRLRSTDGAARQPA